MSEPKYPVGTLLRHRASGEKVLVTEADTMKAGVTYSVAVASHHYFTPSADMFKYTLERAPAFSVTLIGDDSVDLRYEQLLEDPQEVFSPPAWHAPGFRTDATVKIDPKSPVVEIPCRACKQTYDWIPGEGDPFCPRCEPDYPKNIGD